MKPKTAAIVGVSLGLVAGGATAVTVGVPSLAGASSPAAVSAASDDESTTTAPSTDSSTPAEDGTDSAPESPAVESKLSEILQPLIDDGTLTQEQADKVIAALQDAAPFGRGGPGMHGGRGFGFFGAKLESVATALGITEDEVRTALEDGTTIAELATSKGVEVQTVIDALVADATARIDQAVTDGKLTADEATEQKAALTERITEFVNNTPEFGKHGEGRHGPGAPADDSTDSSTDSSPETTAPAGS